MLSSEAICWNCGDLTWYLCRWTLFSDHLGLCLVVVQNEVLKVALRQATKDVDLALNKNKGWSGCMLTPVYSSNHRLKKQNTVNLTHLLGTRIYKTNIGKETNLPSWKGVAKKTLQENLNNSTTSAGKKIYWNAKSRASWSWIFGETLLFWRHILFSFLSHTMHVCHIVPTSTFAWVFMVWMMLNVGKYIPYNGWYGALICRYSCSSKWPRWIPQIEVTVKLREGHKLRFAIFNYRCDVYRFRYLLSMQEIARNCITQHHPGFIRRYKDIYSDLNWGDEFCFIVWCVSQWPAMGLPFNRRYAVSSHGPVVSALIFSNTWQHIVDVLLLSPVPRLAASTVFFPSETKGCESTTNQLYNILWGSVV